MPDGPDRRRGRRRERVERNIYRRVAATGQVAFEVGYRDSAGKQRWQTVEGGITVARAARDDVLGRKGRGEQVRPNPGLRFGEAADAWLAGQVAELRPATQAIYRSAVETHLRSRWGRRRLDAIDVNTMYRTPPRRSESKTGTGRTELPSAAGAAPLARLS